jgi:hypothetical protein
MSIIYKKSFQMSFDAVDEGLPACIERGEDLGKI